MAGFVVMSALGCASAPLRSDVSGLGRYDTRAVQIDVDGAGDPALHDLLRDGAAAALVNDRGLQPALAGDPNALHLALHVEKASEPHANDAKANDIVPVNVQFADDRSGRLVVQGELTGPDGDRLGHVRWDAAGRPADAAPNAGHALAGAVDQAYARGDVVVRRASDERLILTPTAVTLRPGELELSDDEVLAFRLAGGVSDRVQLDVWGGGLPMAVPAGGGLPLPGAIIGGAGGVAALASVLDLGVKVRVLDESNVRPSIAVSYDCLIANLAAVGAGVGGGVGGDGFGVAGGVGVADVHAQFNVFSAEATKHLGHGQLTLGTYVFDNHNFLPQSAELAGVIVGGGAGGSSASGGGGAAAKTTSIQHVPTQVEPFVSGSYALGPHSALAMESFPWTSLRPVLGTTGVRWQLGGGEKVGPLFLNRVTVRLDAAVVWVHYDSTDPQTKQETSGVGYLPWVGVGVGFM
ncbi:MAG: hypothetical protein JST54_31605 [Deltaproteobacteria bacterium]|nr:hypothetical protein [Deltaproteobacteria bacterium]